MFIAMIFLKFYHLKYQDIITGFFLILILGSEIKISLNGTTKKSKIVQISLNYISKKKMRDIKIETNKFGLYGDIVNNKLKIVYKNKTKVKKWKNDKNFSETYKKQHLAIIKDKNKELLCNFNEGFRIFKFLNKLRHLKNQN